MRVLVVDDSAAFRTQIRRVLDGAEGIEVVGTASNGKIALQMLQQKPVDLVTLDLNMPEMDGLEVLQKMKELGIQTKVIVFAAKSARSAKDTIQALSLGAEDLIVKPEGNTFSMAAALEQIESELVPKVQQFLRRSQGQGTMKQVMNAPTMFASETRTVELQKSGIHMKIDVERFNAAAVVIASSTGGPAALDSFFGQFQGKAPRVPVFVAQHMPETFTRFLAKRIRDTLGLDCREGIHGEEVAAGTIYVAPGNFHMRLKKDDAGKIRIFNDQGPKVHSVRPAADLLFHSAVEVYGASLLGCVLTGMGEDGALGAEGIKKAGGAVIIQDKETSAVWGMPAAAHQRGAFDMMAGITDCGRIVAKICT